MKTTIPELDLDTKKNISLWLNGKYDDLTKEKIQDLIQNNPQEAIDAFYTNLSFGTGGMRGIMGVGCNRMNEYTVRAATQGLANYLRNCVELNATPSVFIGYDSRHHSQKFAEESAKVLAANGIQVFLCKNLRPTPLISFGCRLEKCMAAIMITASHNPPEYNGYKVYWADGGQVLPPHDKGIMNAMDKIVDPTMVKKIETLMHPLIKLVEEEIDQPYLAQGSKLQLEGAFNKKFGKELKIVYTSLHGTGITLVPQMLASWGFPTISYVENQIIPDGNFPTVKSPNPEEPSALAIGIQKLTETHSDLLLATDPDADRVGVAINHHGKAILLTGNQIACICLFYVCETLHKQGKMPEKAAFIKTIGTTELFQAICDEFKRPCINVLTGFKYFADKIHQWETEKNGLTYVFGGEESDGYLLGTLTRDKDGIIACALISEIALYAKKQGKTLLDILHDLYKKHGAYFEGLLSVKFDESKSGKERMASGMASLRTNLPKKIDDIEIIAVEDYQNSVKTTLATGLTETLHLPKSNVLLFWLADHSKLMVRPSGTEPKIKIYCGTVTKIVDNIESALKQAETCGLQLLDTMKQLLTK